MEPKYFLFNKEWVSTDQYDSIFQEQSPSVYEVIRVMEQKPLFLEEHYERLIKSLASIGETVSFSLRELADFIHDLAVKNEIHNHNVRLILNGFRQEEPNFYLAFIPTHYPSEDMYRNGVKTDLLSAMRDNPQAKIVNQSLRDQADALIKEKNLFECLLVDDKGNITEGSRSNIFFIKDGCVYTSPAEGVLLGVTRQRILRICRENQIEIKEEIIPAVRLQEYDAAFISGTSPKVLPISTIGSIKMNRDNEVLCRLIALYDEEIQNYLMK